VIHQQNARGDQLALVLHTSGTTKKPKIVPLTSRDRNGRWVDGCWKWGI
jgi:acyl-coenzyme A synthetase/AMP-(fatty) acid ligase